MKQNPKVFSVILNYNGFEDTKSCINSLKQVEYNNLEIIVVDNASTDGSYERLKKEFPEIIVVLLDRNTGYTGGMNAGAKYAMKHGADYIFLTNNDMVYEPDFLNPLVEKLLSDESIGIVSSKVLYYHNKDIIYCAGADFKFFRCGAVNMYQGLSAKKYGNEPREITSAEGCCLLLKKEVFEKAGFYDERYFIYCEDIDFSDRVREYFKIYYLPQSLVYHKAGAGLGWDDYSPFYYYYFTRNRLMYFTKYSMFKKFYAIIYTYVNSFAKTIVLFKSYLLHKGKRVKTKKAINSLWEGSFEGLKIILGFSIPDSYYMYKPYRTN